MRITRTVLTGLVTTVLAGSGMITTAVPAHALDGRADILSITVTSPIAGDQACQFLNVTTSWNIAAGYDVFAAIMHFRNNDGTADSGFDTTDVAPPLFTYGPVTTQKTWYYCPILDGTGSFTAGNTDILVYEESTQNEMAFTSAITTTFGTATAQPPEPQPPVMAPQTLATTSRLVVTRPDAGSKLDFAVYTKAGGRSNDQPVVKIQQRIGATSWSTIATVCSTSGYVTYTRQDKNRHAYRLLVPVDANDGYSANVSAVALPVVTGARPATAPERKLLLRAAQSWSKAHSLAYLDTKDTRVSTGVATWAESIIHARPTSTYRHSVPALVLFHYSHGWKVYRGVDYPKGTLNCAAVPKKARDDLALACSS